MLEKKGSIYSNTINCTASSIKDLYIKKPKISISPARGNI